MRVTSALVRVLLGVAAVSAVSVPDGSQAVERRSTIPHLNSLEKRKGGGGGGGGGGGRGGGGSSSSGGGSSSSSGGGGGGGGGSVGAGSRGGSSSNGGGRTAGGSGVKPGYGGTGAGGGSRSYAGGAATPYAAGGRSPRGIAPFLLPLAALSIFPGIWLASAYAYNFDQPYHFVNRTQKSQDQPDGTNQTLPVSCLCQQYQVCGCDQNDDQSYLDGIVGDGNVGNFDKSVVALSNVNNTQTLVLNGTLPNGTTADGGTDNPSADPTTDSTGAALSALVITASGWWLMVGTVILTVFFL